MRSGHPSRDRAWIIGAALFVAAAGLRLSLLDTARFTGDEARFFSLTSDIVDGRSWPLLGEWNTGGQSRLPGPASFYLFALPLLIARSPEAQYAFVQLLGAATVVVLWLALRRPFGERGAALAGALFALMPWPALFADRTWNPNVLPFFIVVALLCAIRLREQPSSFAPLVIMLPTCAVMAQMHLSVAVAWAGIAVLAVPTARRWNRRALALGVALSVALFVPMIVHELSTSFSNTRHLWAETVGSSGPAERSSVRAVLVPLYTMRFLTLDASYHELSGYWGGPGELGLMQGAFFGTPPRPFHPLRLLALLVSIALALAAVAVLTHAAWRAWRASTVPAHTSAWRAAFARTADTLVAAPFAGAFIAALAANTALIAVTGKPVVGHYVSNLMPFAFIAFAALGCAIFDGPGAAGTDRWSAVAPRRNAILAAAASPWVQRRALLVAAVVVMIGGVEATIAISARVDGRVGLATHRATLAAIRADGARDGNEHEPVHLEAAYRSQLHHWQVFADRAEPTAPRVRFETGARARRYRLVEPGSPRPQDSIAVTHVGSAMLHRIK